MIVRQVCLILLFSAANVVAALRTFPEHNFSVELPAEWTDVTPGRPEAVLASHSPDSERAFVVIGVKLPKERGTAAADVRTGARDRMSHEGWVLDPDQSMTINGQPFISFVARNQSGATIATYNTAAGDEVYMLQAVERLGGGPDPELGSIVQSFRFLSPVKTQPLNIRSNSVGYLIGYHLGPYLFAILGVILWLVFRSKSKGKAA